MNRVKFDTEAVKQPEPTAAAKRRQHHQTVDNQPANTTTSSTQSTTEHQSVTKESQNQTTTMKKSSSKNPSMKQNLIIAIVMVVVGIGTGYLVYSQTAAKSNASASIADPTTPDSADQVTAGEVYGAEQGDTFTDEAEGVLVKGGIKGEGSHRILREGGPARNVYLTSSVLDLNLFVDHQVKVWGETFQAQEAGWLMDVGRVEVVQLNAEKPFEVDTE